MPEALEGIVLGKDIDYIVQQHVMRYIFASKFVKKKTVLDAACGTGYGSSYSVSKGAKAAFGLDVSTKALEYAKTHYDKDNLHFIVGDVRHLPFSDNSFDVVISFETIEHIREHEIYLKEVKRVLKPDGLFICSTPNIKYTQHPYFHLKEFYSEEFFNLLENFFKDVDKYAQYISLNTRIKDLLRIHKLHMKRKLFGIAGTMLSSSPYGEKIKSYIREKIPKPPEPSNYNEDNYEIKDEYKYLFKKCGVEAIKRRFKLLRIMIAVCKNKKYCD